MEYEGQARPFSDMIEFDAEKSVELVDRMIVALEEYLRMEAPMTAPRRRRWPRRPRQRSAGPERIVAPQVATEPVAAPETAEQTETP